MPRVGAIASEGENMAEYGIVRRDICFDVSMLRTHIKDARVWTSLHYMHMHAC